MKKLLAVLLLFPALVFGQTNNYNIPDIPPTPYNPASVNITGGTISGVTGVTQQSTDATTLLATDQFVQNAIDLSMATAPINVTNDTIGTISFDSVGSPVAVARVGTVSSGAITSITVLVPGGGTTAYKLGDMLNCKMSGSNNDALLQVASLSGGGGVASLNILYGGTGYTASTGCTVQPALQSIPYTFVLTGVLPQSETYIMTYGSLVQQSNQWIFKNNATGAYSVTVKIGTASDTATGTGVIIPQGTNAGAFIETDGSTDVYCVSGICLSPQSYTFATLPAASTAAVNQQYFVSDVGANGSFWYSNGTQWNPVNGNITLLSMPVPKGVCPSGSIAATTGINTLGTQLNIIYPYLYCWLPANAIAASSVAGMYPMACTTTSSCVVYSNICTTDPCYWPASPTLVTTGQGIYTQTTGAYLTIVSLPIPGGVMGDYGRIMASFVSTMNATVGSKIVAPSYNFSTAGTAWTSGSTTKTMQGNQLTQNVNSAAMQINTIGFVSANSSSDATTLNSTVNTASSFNLTASIYIQTNTDWAIFNSLQDQLSR